MAKRRRNRGEKSELGVWDWKLEKTGRQVFSIRLNPEADSETFHILAESGDRIVTESSGEPLRWVLPKIGE